jgi:hypothetical protein
VRSGRPTADQQRMRPCAASRHVLHSSSFPGICALNPSTRTP